MTSPGPTKTHTLLTDVYALLFYVASVSQFNRGTRRLDNRSSSNSTNPMKGNSSCRNCKSQMATPATTTHKLTGDFNSTQRMRGSGGLRLSRFTHEETRSNTAQLVQTALTKAHLSRPRISLNQNWESNTPKAVEKVISDC